MSPSDSMRAERDELLVALKEVKAENERLRGSSRDHDPSIGSALDFVREVSRLSHSGDDGYTYPDEPDDDHFALDRLIAKARDINTMPLRQILGEAISRAKQVDVEKSRDELNNNSAKAENR